MRRHFLQSTLTISELRVNRSYGILQHDNVETGITGIERRRANAVVGCQAANENACTSEILQLRREIRALKAGVGIPLGTSCLGDYPRLPR